MSPSLTNDRSPLCGPLPAHINAYLKFPEERGYKQHTIRPDSLLLTDLDDWLVRKGHRVILFRNARRLRPECRRAGALHTRSRQSLFSRSKLLDSRGSSGRCRQRRRLRNH